MKQWVRQIAGSSGPLIAVGAFEREVEVWDLPSNALVSAFQTVLDFGGRRLLLNRNATVCVCAAYIAEGVAAYEVASGRCLWHRRDLKRVHSMNLSNTGEHVYCEREGTSAEVLTIADGTSVDRLRGVKRVCCSPFDASVLFEKARPEMRNAQGRSLRIGSEGWGFLDAAFSPKHVCLSEAGGSTRCFDLDTGDEVFRFRHASSRHIVRLAYSEQLGQFVGLLYDASTAVFRLIHLDQRGRSSEAAVVGRVAEVAFCLNGAGAAVSDGRFFDTASGSLIRTMSYAEKPI